MNSDNTQPQTEVNMDQADQVEQSNQSDQTYNDNLRSDEAAAFTFMPDETNEKVESKLKESEPEETPKKEQPEITFQNPEPQRTTTSKSRISKTPEELAKIASIAAPQLMTNNILLFVCLLLLIIVVIMKNYGTKETPKKTPIDKISEERLKALETVHVPQVSDGYKSTVSSMVAQHFNIAKPYDTEKNEMFDVVVKNGQTFKFAKDIAPPKPKHHAPLNDFQALGHVADRDGYH